MDSQFYFRSISRATGETAAQISGGIREIATRILATRLGLNTLLEELRLWVLPIERCWNLCTKPRHSQKFKSRSVVRTVGTFLPIPPTQRVHIKVVDELINRGNHIYTIDIFNQDDACVDDISLIRERLSSTPIDANILMSPVSMANPRAEMRINQLEDELQKLRAQIATIVASKELYMPNDNATRFHENHAKLPSQPPPPPPPLPSKLLSNCSVPTILPVKCQSAPRRNKENGFPNLKEILKDIGNVRLRKTERSPGGTPFKPKNKLDNVCNDAASILASALKKRFLHLHSFSPEHSQSFDPISEHSWSDTCQSSPTKQKNSPVIYA